MLSYTPIIVASVTSVASETAATVADTVRKSRVGNLGRSTTTDNSDDGKLQGAYVVEAVDGSTSLSKSVPVISEGHHSSSSGDRIAACVPTKSSMTQASKADLVISAHRKTKPGASIPKGAIPKAPRHIVRKFQLSPLRRSRITTPSLARQVIPHKRLVKTQSNIELVPKRRRAYHPYALPVKAPTTPLPVTLVVTSSLPGDLRSFPTGSSVPITIPRKLACGRSSKRGYTVASDSGRHESSRPRQPGQPRILSLAANLTMTEDVEMAVTDAVETPEATMSSPELGSLDEWASVPQTPTPDKEMKPPFDEDVELEGACEEKEGGRRDAYRNGDERMSDWMDDDVVMTEARLVPLD